MPPSAHFYYLFLPLIILPTKLYSYYITVWAIFQGFRLKAKLICYNRYYEKIGNNSPICIDDEVSEFDLPSGWALCRLNSVAAIFTGNSINENEKQKHYIGLKAGYNYIGTKDVGFDHYINYNNGVKIPFNLNKFRIAHKNTPLLCIEGGSAGRKIGILKEDVCFGNKLCAFETICINAKYLYYYLQCPIFTQIFKEKTTGIIGGVSVNTLKNLYFPLPPLAEQSRIVSEIEKFEPLIAEYDKLEQQATKLDDEIYDKLKKSILQYAIQGKLVPQDPNDEPASALLERIREEKKAKLGKKYVDSYIYKGDDNCYYEKVGTNEPVRLDDLSFDIPDSWCWARLGYVINLLSGRDLEPNCYNNKQNGIPYITGASNFINGRLLINRWTNQPVVVSKKGDLLITCKGTIGAMAINSEDIVHIARQVMAVSSIEVELAYIRIFLLYYTNSLQSKAKSLIPGINRADIEDALIPIPPKSEQKRIARQILNIFSIVKDED